MLYLFLPLCSLESFSLYILEVNLYKISKGFSLFLKKKGERSNQYTTTKLTQHCVLMKNIHV